MNIHDVVREMNLPEIKVEACCCGRCNDYWLVGIGSFCQGSGFTEREALLIAAALNNIRSDIAIRDIQERQL